MTTRQEIIEQLHESLRKLGCSVIVDGPAKEGDITGQLQGGWEWMADAYKKTSDRLMGEMETSGRHGWASILVFSICFGYRQSLELRLKGLISMTESCPPEDIRGTHDLSRLWNRVRDKVPLILMGYDRNKALSDLDCRLRELKAIDDEQRWFRYPMGREWDQNNPYRSINLSRLKEVVDAIHHQLEYAVDELGGYGWAPPS